ncbi:TetR/AcrR family transcriptional regulator [Corynebacterium sp. TAE3-ERU12]|uniref:TetR/AcrR family transcriptional regulator n=1 Tax=Corynebacterium sp. TAE3-ERU12 TaxID=2849491 RepID=UPI001C4432D2|nr:TetR family transcriptional regulator [Corynebacterium sp. TAE3-ERU12]MBV7295712.1 TetR/AcrR family transcriptional regulator [Corynebacterium sp. TAE3-ERU12]
MQESIGGCGRRELNRRRTRRTIEDAALNLMAEHGFDAVTLDDVCAAANISRRTFFNYFDTKDEVVLRPGITSFSDADAEAFIAARPSDPVRHLLLTIEAVLTNPDPEDDDLADPMQRHRELHRLRREVVRSDSRLLGLVIANQSDSLARMQQALTTLFTNAPDTRRLPDIAVEEEAAISVAFIRETLWMATSRSLTSLSGDSHPLLTAAATFSRFTQELNW